MTVICDPQKLRCKLDKHIYQLTIEMDQCEGCGQASQVHAFQMASTALQVAELRQIIDVLLGDLEAAADREHTYNQMCMQLMQVYARCQRVGLTVSSSSRLAATGCPREFRGALRRTRPKISPGRATNCRFGRCALLYSCVYLRRVGESVRLEMIVQCCEKLRPKSW